MNTILRRLLPLCMAMPITIAAQRTTEVHGTYEYIVGDNDNITLKEAKLKCQELAKASAIKAEFGELVTSDVINSNAEVNGEAASSYFWENTVALAKGDWLGDTKKPVINVEYVDDKLIFRAEVWGQAREILQAKTELKWKILKSGANEKEPTTVFNNGERIYISFRSPTDGYAAVYLIMGDDDTACLLPYKKDPTGRFAVKHGKDYTFFDRNEDPNAAYYKLSTDHELEYNQLVIIYSPNPIPKCNEVTGDAKHPNSLNTRDFQKWLLRCQRQDRDMVINKKWVKINGVKADGE